ncbi:Metallophosphoesterase [Hyella patelloides LEGE 07179]|uniref:Metallophosphoesterase n=1 Tax=Hyella patelloides LEGE 07179 TaxID=945734 RepID=A0A563VMA6_9CYAN|nr:metallophosphoesterase [Hyella patelloides]VEP12594.1 Metallophosphoesterase [Hyella patelloides LEGE 07179]
MVSNFRFGIISDLHIALPETIQDNPSRFHLVEVSIPALEVALEHLSSLDLDFLLLPGDLTQDGEVVNHQWLANRLEKLPFLVYVIPGNHDVPIINATKTTIAFQDFPHYYQKFGYQNNYQLYYTQEILPGVQLIALNSNNFNAENKQIGYLDKAQISWLEETLNKQKNKLILVTIHHNIIEHFPGQTHHSLGNRYMLDNANILLELLKKYQVKLIFTGHLHVQDISKWHNIYEICTGSLVSYPHPYRIVEIHHNNHQIKVSLESFKIKSVAGWSNLAKTSRDWMGDRSEHFMLKLLTLPPLSLSPQEAQKYAPQLRYFWSDVASGDAMIDFPQFPTPIRKYFQSFSAVDEQGKPTLIDNNTTITL